MMKNLLTFFLILCALCFLQQCQIEKQTASPTSPTVAPAKLSPLAAYGQALFEREACLDCHVLQLEELEKGRISLDGLGGKYPELWLQIYLSHPDWVIAKSQKKSYQHLNTRALDRYFGDSSRTDNDWQALLTAADKLRQRLRTQSADETDLERVEMLALIAYFQQIPTSATQRRADSLELQAYESADWQAIRAEGMQKIVDLAAAPERVAKGKALFAQHCTACHGTAAQGLVGPNLTDAYWLHGGEAADIARSIAYGVPEKGMITWKNILSPEEVGALLAYVQSLRGSKPADAKAPQGERH